LENLTVHARYAETILDFKVNEATKTTPVGALRVLHDPVLFFPVSLYLVIFRNVGAAVGISLARFFVASSLISLAFTHALFCFPFTAFGLTADSCEFLSFDTLIPSLVIADENDKVGFLVCFIFTAFGF